jgi:transcriptional regulator GlxA family with amidase domain
LVFADRFTYFCCAHANALSHSRTCATGNAKVAVEVGYESEAAFNRAFKKHVGAPPATRGGEDECC